MNWLKHKNRNMEQIWQNASKYLMIVLHMDQYMYVHAASKHGSNVLYIISKMLDSQDVRFSHTHEREIFERCRVGWKSVNNNEWICNTCRNAIRKAMICKLSVYNKLGFPTQPLELKLYPLEKWLIAPRIQFMQFRELKCGGQQLVHGNILNVPVDIAPTVNTLTTNMNDTKTIAVKFKWKKKYKYCEFKENIQPMAVWKAANYLLKESTLYKQLNLQIDTTWLETFNNNNIEDVNNVEEEKQTYDTMSQYDNTYTSSICSNSLRNNNVKDLYTEFDDHNTQDVVDMDTMSNEHQVPKRHVNLEENDIHDEITFALGEGQIPISVFQDKDAEYLAFPSIFCGECRPNNNDRHLPIHYSDICKYELRSVDRRLAKHIPNMFFKLKNYKWNRFLIKLHLLFIDAKQKGKSLK